MFENALRAARDYVNAPPFSAFGVHLLCRWLRLCRLLAKQKWRGIGAMGVVTILLAALLLCLTAYFEKWGQNLNTSSSLDSSAPAPTTEEPSYFEDKAIPKVFERYANVHNSAIASPSPRNALYVVYEIPGNTTLGHSLLGLVREASHQPGA